MSAGAYYNEFDPKAAAVLRQLISEGHIAPGYVDERSIEDVKPAELREFTQVHLFAGYGLWSLAFRWAGIGDNERAYSCSCPCQPFSAAGKGFGFADERHLWPAAFHLISRSIRPGVPIYGEQVASSRVMSWIDLVWSDLEGTGHTFRPFVLASAGFGAPIIRQRTYWVAESPDSGRVGWGSDEESDGEDTSRLESERLRDAGGMGKSSLLGCESGRVQLRESEHEGVAVFDKSEITRRSEVSRLDSPNLPRFERWGEPADQCSLRETGLVSGMVVANGRESCDGDLQRSREYGQQPQDAGVGNEHRGSGPTNGFWGSPDWLRCRDDKWRPVESGTFPLAHGDSERVGRLRGYGNAISPQVAAAFVKAHRESRLTRNT